MFLEKRVYQGSSGKVYPLPFTDRISETKVDHQWQAIWLENEFMRVLVLPELGGRIHAIQDKTNGYDLIYNQPVIKPALVGLAGPWASGGIEFNWPQHHRPATFLPVDIAVEEHADGSKTVWCSDHDPMCRLKGMHGICLHPGKSFVELKVRAYNRTPFTQTFLWWANVATRVHEAYQSFFPPDVSYVADHARRSMSTYPLAQGHYYGVNYGERGREGIPLNEIPRQYIPPHCANKFAISHQPSAIPDYSPNDLSFYANIPVPTSYMCMGSQEDFFGGYDFKAQAGIVHLADHHISPGKKQWTWGNHEFGYAWDRNLTEADAAGEFAPYIEIMAGVYTDNQPDFSFLQPGETKTWSQFWYPIQQIGPAQHANLHAAVALRLEKWTIRVGVSVTQHFPGATLEILGKSQVLASFQRNLSPGAPLVEQIKLRNKIREIDLTIRLADSSGVEIISYRPKPRVQCSVPPPAAEPLPPEKISSADELFLTGLHLEQYRHATRCPTIYWRAALIRDPLDSRCNTAMGRWHLRRGEFVKAEDHFRTAIQSLTRRNFSPQDGEPSYHLGLTLRYLGRDDEAYAAFYKATWNQAWAAAGFHALAEIDCGRKAWPAALDHLNRALRLDTDDLRVRDLKTVVLRKLNQPEEAETWLLQTLALDPLDWWAHWLLDHSISCDAQTRLDLAHDFTRAGFYAEAIELLEEVVPDESRTAPLNRQRQILPGGGSRFSLSPNPSPVGTGEGGRRPGEGQRGDPFTGEKAGMRADVIHTPSASGAHGEASPAPGDLPDQNWGAMPLVLYTLGWLREKLGDEKGARAAYRRAAAESPDYCFPARLEEILILKSAIQANPKDARAPYYLGNLLYDRRRHAEAIQSWERSAKLGPAFSVVWRNLGIGWFNVSRQPAKAKAAYDQAFKANPADARLLFERDQLWKRLGEKPQARLRELEKFPELTARRDDLCVELCALCNQVGRHQEALALVSSRKFQPWEGGEGGPLGQWVRSHLALGQLALRRGEADEARGHFAAALTAPHNLGEARHLLANQSDIHYWLGAALSALGDKKAARDHWRAAAEFKGDFQEMSVRSFSELTFYSARAWEKLGQQAKAKQLFRDLQACAQRLEKSEAKVEYFATSLPTMLLFDDDLQFRQETRALFMQAQARAGLGANRRAKSLLAIVLQRDPNHPLAADLKKELGAGRIRCPQR